MGFLLTIAEGKEAGREFVFEQPSVTIGRTSECDVILYDPGVSRRHARIFAEGAGYFVEDMGSSNGTKVNGSVVQKAKLNQGDAISLGPVVFNFAPVEHEPQEPGSVADASTRIVAADDVRRARQQKLLAPANANDGELSKLARSSTRAMPAIRKNGASAAIAVHDDSDDDSDGGPLSPQRSLSVADRARIRRESPGFSGSLKIWWLEASDAVRNTTLLALALVTLGALGGVAYWLVIANEKEPLPPEPLALSRALIGRSFGLGDGVDYERPNEKVFGVDYTPPVDALLIVHFQSQDISEGEVVLFANGKDVEKLPADLGDVRERSNEVVIRPQFLKRGEPNQLVFDNLRNPPGKEPWRIWNLWVETVPLVIKPPKQLVLDAQEVFDRGTRTQELKDVGASNRYRAWKDFREAWLMLEAHPDPKPELYLLARDQMRLAQQELDQRCRMLMIDFQREYSHNQFEAARSTLDFVKEYFPSTDQPCPLRAEQMRAMYDL